MTVRIRARSAVGLVASVPVLRVAVVGICSPCWIRAATVVGLIPLCAIHRRHIVGVCGATGATGISRYPFLLWLPVRLFIARLVLDASLAARLLSCLLGLLRGPLSFAALLLLPLFFAFTLRTGPSPFVVLIVFFAMRNVAVFDAPLCPGPFASWTIAIILLEISHMASDSGCNKSQQFQNLIHCQLEVYAKNRARIPTDQ